MDLRGFHKFDWFDKFDKIFRIQQASVLFILNQVNLFRARFDPDKPIGKPSFPL